MYFLQHIVRRRKHQHKTCCNKEKYEEHNHKKCQYIREKGGWDCFNMIEIERIPVMMVRKPEYWRCYFDCQIHARKSHQPIAQR